MLRRSELDREPKSHIIFRRLVKRYPSHIYMDGICTPTLRMLVRSTYYAHLSIQYRNCRCVVDWHILTSGRCCEHQSRMYNLETNLARVENCEYPLPPRGSALPSRTHVSGDLVRRPSL